MNFQNNFIFFIFLSLIILFINQFKRIKPLMLAISYCLLTFLIYYLHQQNQANVTKSNLSINFSYLNYLMIVASSLLFISEVKSFSLHLIDKSHFKNFFIVNTVFVFGILTNDSNLNNFLMGSFLPFLFIPNSNKNKPQSLISLYFVFLTLIYLFKRYVSFEVMTQHEFLYTIFLLVSLSTVFIFLFWIFEFSHSRSFGFYLATLFFSFIYLPYEIYYFFQITKLAVFNASFAIFCSLIFGQLIIFLMKLKMIDRFNTHHFYHFLFRFWNLILLVFALLNFVELNVSILFLIISFSIYLFSFLLKENQEMLFQSVLVKLINFTFPLLILSYSYHLKYLDNVLKNDIYLFLLFIFIFITNVWDIMKYMNINLNHLKINEQK